MKILLVLIFIPVFLSCDSHTLYPIHSFFNELQQSVDKERLEAFKNAPEDSAVYYFRKFDNEFLKIYHDSAQTVLLNKFFKGNHVGSKFEYLCFAFHSWLNHKKFNNAEILNDTYNEYTRENAKWENKLKLLNLENYHIMQTNDKRWKVGDLIKIILPVEFKEGTKSARYYNNYYASLDPFGFVDSLKINAKILEKRYLFSDDTVTTDTAHIIFKLKITKLNHPDYKIFYKKLRVGDTLDLYLKAYCRYIY